MQAQDDQRWSEQLAQWDADEQSRKFRDFLVFWLDTADRLIGEDYGRQLHPYDALSNALTFAEQSFGYLSVEWLSQMLLVTTEHWVHGPRVLSAMSVFERRMVDQAAALKLVELQSLASADDSC